MDFFLKNIRETLEAINKLIDNNIFIVNTKRIRKCRNIKPSDRSKINFIWRSLEFLWRNGILEPNGAVKPKNYKIKNQEKIDIDQYIGNLDKKR